MTVATLYAVKLGEILQAQHTSSDTLDGMASQFQKELAEDLSWLLVTEGGPKHLDIQTRFHIEFLKKVMVAFPKGRQVTEALYGVVNIVATQRRFRNQV